jgi:hypothetical protein
MAGSGGQIPGFPDLKGMDEHVLRFVLREMVIQLAPGSIQLDELDVRVGMMLILLRKGSKELRDFMRLQMEQEKPVSPEPQQIKFVTKGNRKGNRRG